MVFKIMTMFAMALNTLTLLNLSRLLRSGGLKVRLAQDNCGGEFKGKGDGKVFGNDQR